MAWFDLSTEVQKLFGEYASPSFGGISWETSHVENRPSRGQGPDYTKPVTIRPKEPKPMNDAIPQDVRNTALNTFLTELPHYRSLLFDLARVAGLSRESETPSLWTDLPKNTPPASPQKETAFPEAKDNQRPQVINNVIKAVTTKTGVSLSTLLERDTNPTHCNARYICYHLSHKLGGVKLSDVAMFFDRSRERIRQAIEKFHSELKKNDDLQKLLEECATLAKKSSLTMQNGVTK